MTTGEFLLLVFEDERAHLAQTPRAMGEHLDAQRGFAARLRARGALADCGRLRPGHEGRRVRRARGGAGDRPAVECGPIPRESAALALFYCVRASTAGEAAAIAAECPTLPTDEVEVRPVMKGRLDDGRALRRGRVFGFAVLGSAPSPAAWDGVMDRIDADTSRGFPEALFLGGVRLHGPASGQRVVTRGERRAVVDGPFPEGREVIGGLFFLRLPALDDAVQWAGASPFVAHGALEVRELWRG